MDVALQTKTSFVLPKENKSGINYLRSKGFIQTLCASRMTWGEDINVKLNLIYNRIGGNLG